VQALLKEPAAAFAVMAGVMVAALPLTRGRMLGQPVPVELQK
jgi:hypothetical protein